MQPFVWGAGGSKDTFEGRAKKRAVLDALMARGTDTSPVQHWAQGLARVSQGVLTGLEARDLDKRDKEANEREAGLIAEMTGAASPVANVAQAMASSGVTNGDSMSRLIASESGGRWDAQNNAVGAGGKLGHFGRLQFGQARLQDAERAGVLPPGTTPQAFMASPELQKAAEAWHFADIDRNIQSAGLDRMVGQQIGGAPVTMEGMRAVAHLGGIGGLRKFMETGGRYNPADANGTRLSDYLARMRGNVITPPNVGNNMAVTPTAPTAPMPNMADVPAAGASPTAMPGQGFAVPTQGVAETEEDVLRAEMETGMRQPTPTEALFSNQPTPGAPAFQPGPAVAGAPQMANVPLPPPRPPMADMPAQGAQTAMGGPPPGYTPGMLAPIQERADPAPYLAPFQEPQAPTAAVAAAMAAQGGQPPSAAPAGVPAAPQNRMALTLRTATDPNVSPQVRQIAMAIYSQEQAKSQPQPMTIQKLEDGTVLGIDPRSGNTRVLFQGAGKDTRTPEQKNFELAKSQGFQGTFQEYQTSLKRAGAPNVDARNMGNIPAGYQLVELPDGTKRMEPIPGSPAERDMRETARKDQLQKTQRASGASIVVQDIDRAIKGMDTAILPTTGAAGSVLSRVPGTTAHNISKLLDTVKANAGFDAITAMRESSPTGAALGSVTEKELALLQATIGSLEQSQDDKQLRDNMKRVKNVYLDIIHGKDKGPARERLSFDTSKEPEKPAPAGVDPTAWKFMTPEERALWK
jgi:hypothetical protein